MIRKSFVPLAAPSPCAAARPSPTRARQAIELVTTLALMALGIGLGACGEAPPGGPTASRTWAASDAAVDDVPLRDFIAAQHGERTDPAPQALRVGDAYPILLVHGMGGFRPVAQALDYFYRVRLSISAAGHVVYATQCDPFQGVAFRGRQLAVQVDEVLRLTGASKVQLIAHSQGGLDARYLISSLGYGDRVDTLITVGTPHHGVVLADMALRLKPSWVGRLATVVNALSDSILGGHADLLGQLHDLTSTHVDGTFNPRNPNDPRVAYFSYTGVTQASPFIDARRTDLVNAVLLPTYRLLLQAEGQNDGLVSVRSGTWGTHMGSLPADHWDEIGQPPTLPHEAFDHVKFYVALARFLDSRAPVPLY